MKKKNCLLIRVRCVKPAGSVRGLQYCTNLEMRLNTVYVLKLYLGRGRLELKIKSLLIIFCKSYEFKLNSLYCILPHQFPSEMEQASMTRNSHRIGLGAAQFVEKFAILHISITNPFQHGTYRKTQAICWFSSHCVK